MAERFRFRKHASIGAADAEDDQDYLSECFIDTGDLEVLSDCDQPNCIVLGRTGSGKTALITRLNENDSSISIKPETLSFNFLVNSSILQFFMEAGVKLDLFFQLLWRHIFTVELLKKRYNIKNFRSKKSFIDRFSNLFIRDVKKEKAVNYLMQWGEHFWEDTEYRIKEITTKVENDLRGSLEGKLQFFHFGAEGVKKLTDEERTEVVKRGQNVINSIQMKELSNILDFLNDDVFDDKRHKFYITIDRLDENWVDDQYRYSLIRSLMETVRDFRKVERIKIIVAIRKDLLERVFRFTRDYGFQEEKYRSIFLTLKWSNHQLQKVLNSRVNYLIKRTYIKKEVQFKDIVPAKIDKKKTIDYFIDKTLRRPREVIEFFNECIKQSEGKTSITISNLRIAEGEYSKNRFRSLDDEWHSEYPSLLKFAFILRKKPKSFKISDLKGKEVEEFCLDFTINNLSKKCPLAQEARKVAEVNESYENFLLFLFHVFYKTGIVGLKLDTYEKTAWCYEGPETIGAKIINKDAIVSIHPMFFRVLGIKP